MPSLKAIRKRIVSVKNTQKITKAMKMVAAAKLRRAQEAVQAIRPYAKRMHQVLEDLAERVDQASLEERAQAEEGETRLSSLATLDKFLHGGPERRIRLVAVTSDRGLAGAFNSNVNRRSERFIVERRGAEIEMVVLGKKGRDYQRRRPGRKIVRELPGPDGKNVQALAQELGKDLFAAMEDGQTDAIYVVYNEFKSAATQTVKVERLMPLQVPPPPAPEERERELPPRTLLDFVYEPDQGTVLRHLIPLGIQTELHRILLESIASEMGAKMSAMDNAARNAKEMISRLTLQYNRARQAAITKELMEIVGGAEALKG